MLLSLANFMLRVIRWRRYLSLMGHPTRLGFASLAYVSGFAFSVTPGKLGELARMQYYVRAGVPLEDLGGALFVERLMDLLAALLLASIISTPFPHYTPIMLVAAGLTIVCLVVLAALPWSRISIALSPSSSIPRVIVEHLRRVLHALACAGVLLRVRALTLGLLLGLIAWLLEGAGLCLLGSIVEPGDLTITAAVGIYAISELLGVVSLIPGGLGSTEAVMIALLAARGYAITAAILISLTYRLVTLWLAVGLGWGAIIALRHQRPEIRGYKG